MTEVFDTYSKRTKAYYVMLLIVIVLFLVCALIYFSVIPLSEMDSRYLYSISIFVIASWLFFRNSFIKMYIKDGEMSFSNTAITLNSFIIPLREIKKIVFKANDYKGNQKGTSDGSGNFIDIHTKDDKVYKSRFVINSAVQKDNLTKIADQWREQGVIVTESRL